MFFFRNNIIWEPELLPPRTPEEEASFEQEIKQKIEEFEFRATQDKIFIEELAKTDLSGRALVKKIRVYVRNRNGGQKTKYDNNIVTLILKRVSEYRDKLNRLH